jgi:SAM-dependent methyltransferase
VIGRKVREFYDSYGWKYEPSRGRYRNDVRFGPPDALLKEEKGCEARYWKYFNEGGKYFLDAGCGAKPITQIGDNFYRHVCLDASHVGLQEARRKVGDRGFFVVADLSSLPFRDEAFDGLVASYCLYQLEEASQRSAMQEFYRVIKVNKILLVFYVSKNSLISASHRIGKNAIKIYRAFRGRIHKESAGGSHTAPPPPDFYVENPFRLSDGFADVDVTCLRTLTRIESYFLRKIGLLNPALRLFSFLEQRFPHAMLLVGAYVAIRVRRVTNATSVTPIPNDHDR